MHLSLIYFQILYSYSKDVVVLDYFSAWIVPHINADFTPSNFI